MSIKNTSDSVEFECDRLNNQMALPQLLVTRAKLCSDSVFSDRVQTFSARALPSLLIIMHIHWKRDLIMHILQIMRIHQYALLLRVHIIIPVLLIKNGVIMHIRISENMH